MALGAFRESIGQQLSQVVAAGLVLPDAVDGVALFIEVMSRLEVAGVVSEAFVQQQMSAMADEQAARWRARHPEWNTDSGVQ